MKEKIVNILSEQIDDGSERLGLIADEILELFQEETNMFEKEIDGLRDAILEGEKRWSKGEKAILAIMDVKNLEYHVLHCKLDEAENNLNSFAKQRWEPKFVNCRNSYYYATMVRRKL